jgi:hypothetical protein
LNLRCPIYFANGIGDIGLSGAGFSLRGFGLASTKTHRLKRLRKKVVYCHPERSEGSAFSPIAKKKQIPRANCALGMTLLEFFRNL